MTTTLETLRFHVTRDRSGRICTFVRDLGLGPKNPRVRVGNPRLPIGDHLPDLGRPYKADVTVASTDARVRTQTLRYAVG